MEKTMNIKGMMCGHCSGTVKKELEALPEVKEAIVSFQAGTAIVKMTEELPDEILKDIVEKAGFEVFSIQYWGLTVFCQKRWHLTGKYDRILELKKINIFQCRCARSVWA